MRRTFCGFLISVVFGGLLAQPAPLTIDDLYQDLSQSPPELGAHMFLSHVGRVQFTKPKDRVLILEQALAQAAQIKSGSFPIVPAADKDDRLAYWMALASQGELGRLNLEIQILEKLAESDPHAAAERFLEIPLPADLILPCKLQRSYDFEQFYTAAAVFTAHSEDRMVYARRLARRLVSSGQLASFLTYVESIGVPLQDRLELIQMALARLPLLRLDSRSFYSRSPFIAKFLRENLSPDQYGIFLKVVESWLREEWCLSPNLENLTKESPQIQTWKALHPNAPRGVKAWSVAELRQKAEANEGPEFWQDSESRALKDATDALVYRSDFVNASGIWTERFRQTLRKIQEARKPDSTAAVVWYLQNSQLFSSMSLLQNDGSRYPVRNPKRAGVETPQGQPLVIDEMQTHEALLQMMGSQEGEAVKQQNPALWLMGFQEVASYVVQARPDLRQRFADLIVKTNPSSPALLLYFESLLAVEDVR